jgi:hypothetical protein
MGRGMTGTPNLRFTPYHSGGWVNYSPTYPAVRDPDDLSSTFSFDPRQKKIINITYRVVLGTAGYAGDSFYEVFINNKFAGRREFWPDGSDVPIKLRDCPIVVDALHLSYQHNVLKSKDTPITFDDFYVFMYKPQPYYQHGYINQRSPDGRILLNPVFNRAGNYKKSNYK